MTEEKYSPKAQLIKKVWDNYITKRVLNQEAQKFNIDAYLAEVICPGPFYYYIIDFSDRSLPFVSSEAQGILGLDPREYDVEKFLEILHPDDAGFMAACEDKICDFLYNKITPDRLLKYKFTYKFRLRHKSGQYKHILHQAIGLSVDDQGQLHHVLGIHVDIGHITRSLERQVSFIGLKGEPSFLGLNPTDEHYPDEPGHEIFTARERKIISLMAEGLTTAEVAEILHISTATAATHRKNILNKSNCRNMIEVIVKALREGII